MTLDRLRPLADRMLGPFVDAARRLGVTPDQVSVIALVAAVGAGLAFAGVRWSAWGYLLGAVLVFLNGWLDLVDGALARETATSSAGGDLLDHVFDRYADIVVVAGLAAGIDNYALGLAAVTGVLMTSYLGTQAQAVGLDRVYAGVLGRADRLALIGVGAAATWLYGDPVATFTIAGWVLVVLAVVGHVTALQRFAGALRALPDEE